MHLTLIFFGPTEDLLLKKIKISIEKVLKGHKSFSIEFNHLGVFGSKYQPRVLWMGMKNTTPLVQLVTDLKEELEQIGIKNDRQNFVPHLTVGRIKKLQSKKYFQSVVNLFKEFDSGPIKVNRIFLYQSILRKEGPEYRVLEEYVMES